MTVYLMVNDKTGAVDIAPSRFWEWFNRGYHVEEVQDVRTATEHGYTTIRLNGKAVAHVDKTLDGRYLLTWDVPSVNRLDYTDSLENTVKTVLYAFNGG